ncbi:LuxR family transcriptional regulator, partial [Rhizobium johnstonii]
MSYMTTSERQSFLSAELSTARTRSLFAQALVRISTAFGLSHATLMHAPSPEASSRSAGVSREDLPG